MSLHRKSSPATPSGALEGTVESVWSSGIHAHALDTFGDEAKAIHWLTRSNPLFEGKTPLELMESDPVAVDVELTRIDHGIFT